MPQDYNNTLNLPVTDFSMRGNLTQKEPPMVQKWEEEKLYKEILENNEGKPLYVLHDGPPYANGDIHMGHALNKVLKDIIVRYKNMNGFCSPYIPGWDTHGLPIELKAMKSIGVENGAIPPVELRKHCREFALSYVKNQAEQFKRLGILGDFDDPYLTLKPEFEATQIQIFGEMAKNGYIYKGLKPVYWCPECQTALAEAEIEYANDNCHSIYVKFRVCDDKGIFAPLGIDLDKTFFVIWTTTTWTLPGNLAICLGPEYEYTVVKAASGENYVMAKELADGAMKAAKITEYEMVGSFLGKELEYVQTEHPFMNRKSPIIIGDHVTLESGTGCVHTAPGHGVEDFEVCKNYKEIPIVVPVDSKGVLTKDAGEFEGLKTEEANKKIAQKLEDIGALFALEKIVHQYPHCWRCKQPVLFRATEQWFCSVDGFKNDAIKAIESVEWIPEWGEDRIKGMVRDRSDWCISRQRTWGVPIPIIYCKECNKPIVNSDTINAISDLFRKEGSDAWYTKELLEFIPSSVKCECGCTEFRKEMDIMDVWFDSGVSHAAVLENRGLPTPADLYLEGADQYRGWFQSSLLTSVAWKGVAPYKAVCTHGWVVDGEGKAMHKSLGNGIEPKEVYDVYGADILRLWVASSDYHSDVRISKAILGQLSDAYKKIRNTARFILGNLCNGNGFNPNTDAVSPEQLLEIDRYALMKYDMLIDKVKGGYDSLDFHIAFKAIHNFCVTDMSNFYLDIIKDRLYCTKECSVERRAAQTTMYIILSGMSRLIAPIMPFTAEEIWSFMPHTENEKTKSIMLNLMPEKMGLENYNGFEDKWNTIATLREDVNKALEEKRNEKLIGKSLEAKVTLVFSNSDDFDTFSKFKDELAAIFIVSQVKIAKSDETFENASYIINVEKAEGEKCERCWTCSETVGKNADHPTLCERCVKEIN